MSTIPNATFPAFLQYHVTSAAATTVSDTTSYFPLAGTTTYSVSHPYFTHTDNALTYVDTRRHIMWGIATIAYRVAAADQTLKFSVQKNGSTLSSSVMSVTTDESNKTRTSTLNFMVTMDTNVTIRIGVKNETAANNVTALNMNLCLLVAPQQYDVVVS